MSFFQRLFHPHRSKKNSIQKDSGSETLSKSQKGEAPLTATIDGKAFTVCLTVDALCEAIKKEGCGCLKFSSTTYGTVLAQLTRRLADQYGKTSREYLDSVPSPLLCAGCMWEFPGSYMLSLQAPELFGGLVVGATRGYDQFGKTGTCPQCGSSQSLLVYECFRPESISKADVEAIRIYWQSLAKQWWQQNSHRAGAICDFCNSDIGKGSGYLSGNRLICETCVSTGLMTKGLKDLKRDPHYYGSALLRKARRFRL